MFEVKGGLQMASSRAASFIDGGYRNARWVSRAMLSSMAQTRGIKFATVSAACVGDTVFTLAGYAVVLWLAGFLAFRNKINELITERYIYVHASMILLPGGIKKSFFLISPATTYIDISAS